MSSDQVCVLTAINDKGDVFVDAPCLGQLDVRSAKRSLAGLALSGAVVSTDSLRSYAPVVAELDAALHRRVDSKDRSKGVINLVNALHSRLAAFLARFRGVSTRRLHGYLMWFKWLECARRAGGRGGRLDLLSSQMAKGRYVTTWREYKDTPYPFGIADGVSTVV